ncbi:MAG: preprotein translocase subunit SecE [Christensenellaceae bacterium]
MAKTTLLGKDKEKKLKEHKKIAKQKNKKPRRSPIKFFKDIWREVKKVTWPTRKELFSYTGAILVFVIAIGVVLTLVDLGLGEVLKLLIK